MSDQCHICGKWKPGCSWGDDPECSCEQEMESVEAERDRYREALQAICDLGEVGAFPGTYLIASEALTPNN